jgi:hypothetical protein
MISFFSPYIKEYERLQTVYQMKSKELPAESQIVCEKCELGNVWTDSGLAIEQVVKPQIG